MRRNVIIILIVVLTLGFLLQLTYMYAFYWFLGVMGVFTIIAIHDIVQKKNSILRNYPLFGHLRYILREISPEIRQYFVEGNTDGAPFNKNQIELVNSRAKLKEKNHPFGTEENIYRDGHEWVPHSQFPADINDVTPRVVIGGKNCSKPYSASILNISAMSFGSLSSHAILALNAGAAKGNFYHNTGEGAISPYHTKPGGDLVWQIGTAYFGCRTDDGRFAPELFRQKAAQDNVKMIEIKLSQGAKPGHGGILPAAKNSKEIAKIRGVKPHTTIHSSPFHTAFKGPDGLLNFVAQLRELSGGKPVGFKLCIGSKTEFKSICQEMVNTGIKPDFITVDGAEGGTGAAPLEFSNFIGMPGQEAISFVSDTLRGYGLRKDVRVIFSGKVISGFDIIRAMAAGADICNSARAMMFSLGCIQSLRCHNNTCPTGIATQKKNLVSGLDVKNKSERVFNFHNKTVDSAVEITAAMGIDNMEKIRRKHIYQWSAENNRSMRLDEIYPVVEDGAYLSMN